VSIKSTLAILIIILAFIATPVFIPSSYALADGYVAAEEDSAATAENKLPIIRPGEEVKFKVEGKTFIPPQPKTFGKIVDRVAQLIDTSCQACEMGKIMIADQDDNVWFLITREDKVVKIEPDTLQMTEYTLPLGSAPYSIGIDSKGVLWLSAHGIEMLLEFDPKTQEVISHAPPSHGFLVHVNVDKKSDTVYFAQPGANEIVSFHRDQGFTEFNIPTPQSGPARLDFDSEGNVWFAELYANKLAKLVPATKEFKEWSLPTKDGFPSYARVDQNGTVWVSQPMADRIVKFKDEKFTEFVVPTKNSIVSTQLIDKEGNVWFTEGGWRGSAGGNKVGRLDPNTGKFEELEIPLSNAQPAGIVMTKGGDIWFQLSARGKIVRLKALQEEI
jgi:virginiamycin B lyase